MIEIEGPDGSIVEFPDGTPDETINKAMSDYYSPQKSLGDTAKGLGATAAQGVSMGFSDEIAAGLAAPVIYGLKNALTNDKVTLGEAYDYGLEAARGPVKEFRQSNPKTAIAAELTTGLAGGIPLAGVLNAIRPIQAVGTAGQQALRGAATGAGAGAVSGGIYGFGTGEEGAANRLSSGVISGALGGALGGAGGAVGGAISGSLADRARKLLEIKRARQNRIPPDMSGYSVAANVSPDAVQKVIQRLRADYPDEAQFQQALKMYSEGQGTLGEIGGEKTKDLALGAAQYPSGKAQIQEFFYGKAEPGQAPVGGALSQARDNVTQSIEKNISSNNDFFGTLDDIVEQGRVKAAPLYEKANQKVINPSETLAKPEIQAAISRARRDFPSELEGFPDNSVKVLDYAKRVLDDEIGAAQRGGGANFARSRTEIKNQLLSEIDAQAPEYAKARKQAGDYLSNKAAMEAGKQFKGNSKQIARDFKKLGETEQQSYRAGVVQNVREMVDKVRDTGNVHAKIFGTPETRAKLKAVLPDKEFKQLSDDLWASDRIYKFRDKVLGNSTTASKQISAQEFGVDPIWQDLATGRPVAAGTRAVGQWVKKQFDGLSDKTAGDVARILTAQNDADRWKIIRQISDQTNPKEAARLTGNKSLKTYYQIEDMIKPFRGKVSGITGGNIGSQPLRPELQPQVDLPGPYDLQQYGLEE